MKQSLYRVVESVPLWSNTHLVTIDAPDLACSLQAGQGALLRDPNTFDPYLRRLAWLYRIENEHVTFSLPADDALTCRLRIGDVIDVLAPLGSAIQFDANIKHLLLIGEGERIVQLMPIAETAIRQNREVVLVHHALAPEQILPVHLLAAEIEYHADAVNNDLLAWADALLLSGSADFYRTMADAARATRYRLESGFVYGLMDVPMPCGTGECFACAIDTRTGVGRVCVDGPWFDLRDLELRGAR